MGKERKKDFLMGRDKEFENFFKEHQNTLFRISSEIVVGAEKRKKMGSLLTKDDAEWIKTVVYQLDQKVRPESCFHVPGSSEISSLLNVARAVSRRAERSVVALFAKDKLKNDHLLVYLNCVSDVLFLMAGENVVKKKRKTAGKRPRGRKAGK